MIRIRTTPDIYRSIVNAHAGKDLVVFSSFTNPDGTAFGGGGSRGEVYTLWGLKGAEFPLLEAHSTWDIEWETKMGEFVACRKNEVHVYSLLSPEDSDVDDGVLCWKSLI